MSQTEVLAIWGAITGSIGTIAGLLGLWLRFKQHNLDKPKLNCESSFGFDAPDRPNHKLIIRAVGRRPVVIDVIRYYITPKNWKHRISKKWQHKKGRWLWDQEPRSKLKLTEGEKTEVHISLPDCISIVEIYKVDVVDQTGKKWPIKWQSKDRLEQIATHEKISDLLKENSKRIVSATAYRLGEKYFLETKFNTKPGRTGCTCGRSFWFLDNNRLKQKLDDISEHQIPKFLSGEIEEIQ